MTDDELIAKAERELATLTMCMSPDEVAKLEAHRLIALARAGVAVQAASPAPSDEGVVESRVRMLEGTLNYIRTQAKANHPGVLEVIIANVNTALDGKHLGSVRSAALAAIKEGA